MQIRPGWGERYRPAVEREWGATTIGAWRVSWRRHPWGLELSPLQGGASLVSAGPAGGAIGPPGFQTAPEAAPRRWREGGGRQAAGTANRIEPGLEQWWEAEAVVAEEIDGEHLQLVTSTTHPDGCTLTVEVRPSAHDAVEVVVAVVGAGPRVIDAVGHGFVAGAGERWMGFGERSDAVVRASGAVEAYVGEGPYQDHEYPFLYPLIPGWALRERADATYYPVPWALSTRGIGVLVDNDEVAYHRLRPGGRPQWSIEVEAAVLRYRVFPGPTPLDALARFSAATGRQPTPARPWWFGPWVQTGHANHVPLAEERGHIERLQRAGAPVSAVETHCRYLPLGEHRGHQAEERARVEAFHTAGLACLSYLNCFVGADFAEAFDPAVATGGLQRRPDGSPYTFRAYAGGRTPPEAVEAQWDFTSPAGVAGWAQVAAELVDAGHDGWMEDFGEYTPFDAASADGTPGEAAHNRYPTDYHRAAAAVAAGLGATAGRPLARFVRSGWTGTAPWAPIVWGGDPTTGWGFDGLASAVRQGLSMGASGVGVWGCDTGGFFSSLEQLDVELLIRWIQFSSLTPVLRTKASGIEVFPYDRPQVWDREVLPTWTRWSALHTQLLPYLRAAVGAYVATGVPPMRACGLLWPDSEALVGLDDQYLLGDDLLVAPVLGPGVRSRQVVVPPGRWVQLWSRYRWDPSTRGLIAIDGEGVVHDGGPSGRVVEVPAPLDEIPVLVRAGARIDLLDPGLQTLAPFDHDPPAAAHLQL